VGANNGLNRFQGGVERVSQPRRTADNSIWGLAAGAGGGLWIGTHTGGLIDIAKGASAPMANTTVSRQPAPGAAYQTGGRRAVDRHGWRRVSRFAEGKFSSYPDPRRLLQPSVIDASMNGPRGQPVDSGTPAAGSTAVKEYRVTMRTMREGLPATVSVPSAGPLRRHRSALPPASPPTGLGRSGGITARRTGPRAT